MSARSASVQVERVLEDVVGVEADRLGLRIPSSTPISVPSQVELIIPSSSFAMRPLLMP